MPTDLIREGVKTCQGQHREDDAICQNLRSGKIVRSWWGLCKSTLHDLAPGLCCSSSCAVTSSQTLEVGWWSSAPHLDSYHCTWRPGT
ncbi:hypothetical protein O3P69_006350 [Scylla paramamosain]|uniref:Uncharacterized protein n=1 Tax=Scylla paramamosain TaxID=85552 RepID=A0AAW0U6S4_SCYPA